MTGQWRTNWRYWALRALASLLALALLATQATAPVTAGSGDRTLWLYHTHTHETAQFTFKHNGQFDQRVLAQMNTFLADWRTHRPARMDPHLFDLLWEVYQDVGAQQPYNIVSSYREPKTNAMLRARSKMVAENSQHMLGKAMDVFIPGVPLPVLRAAAMRHQVGGVGYYPTSGSPFVHMDTGNVRAWPRMTRAQLKTVFPDGKTLHLPVDGTPLSNDGRQYAMVQWNKCHMVPCSGDGSVPAVVETDDEIRVAALDPAQRTVSTINIVAPTPMSRRSEAVQVATAEAATVPAGAPGSGTIAPFSKSPSMMVATRGALSIDGQSALTAIQNNVQPMPTPRVLMTPTENQMLTAYAPEMTPEPGAQEALRILIERETTATALDTKKPAHFDTGAIRTASLGGTNGLDVMKNIFDMTWTAMGGQESTASGLTRTRLAPTPVVGLKARAIELVAPEIDHVNETLATPTLMTDIHYADMYEPEGYLDNTSELGEFATSIGLEPDTEAPPRYDRFVVSKPLLVASR